MEQVATRCRADASNSYALDRVPPRLNNAAQPTALNAEPPVGPVKALLATNALTGILGQLKCA